MAGSPFLALRGKSDGGGGTAPVTILYNNPPSSISLGSTFGVFDTSGNTNDQPVNRIVYFSSNNVTAPPPGSAGSLYAAVGNNIYRSTDGGNSWVIALALPSIDTTSNVSKTGLNIVTGGDGLQYLCLMYVDTSTTAVRGVKSTDGYTWTTNGPFNLPGRVLTGQGFKQDTVFGHTLYSIGGQNGDTGFIFCYEVSNVTASGGISAISGISGAETLDRAALCVWSNNLYAIGYNDTTGARPLYRIEGGIVTQVKNVVSSGTNATATYKPGIFVDSGNLYVFVLLTGASTGWGCYQIDTPGTYNVTNITSLVITGSMSGAGPGTSSRVLTYVDGNNTPGANPAKYVLYSANGSAGTAFEMFQWNGSSTAMTSIATGGNVVHALTVSKATSSNGVYDPFGTYAYIISSGPTTSGTVGWRINFTLWGPSGTIASLRLWYGVKTDAYLTLVGTLANPSSGSLGANNTSITGLSVDSGVTLYSVTWVPPTNIKTAADARFNLILQTF